MRLYGRIQNVDTEQRLPSEIRTPFSDHFFRSWRDFSDRQPGLAGLTQILREIRELNVAIDKARANLPRSGRARRWVWAPR